MLDRGKLSKSEVLLLFGCPPEDYEDLKKEILKLWGRQVQSGPRRIGGFVAKYRGTGRPKTVTLLPTELKLSEWERASCLDPISWTVELWCPAVKAERPPRELGPSRAGVEAGPTAIHGPVDIDRGKEPLTNNIDNLEGASSS